MAAAPPTFSHSALADYVLDANDVLRFKMVIIGIFFLHLCSACLETPVQVKSAEDMEDESKEFLPEMCHQIYGDNENIFGYRGLKISLYMSAASLRSYVAVSHEDKVKLRTLDKKCTLD